MNDVLDFRQLDSSSLTTSVVPTNLEVMIATACRQLRTFVRSSIPLRYRLLSSNVREVVLDPRRVMQIITNGIRSVLCSGNCTP